MTFLTLGDVAVNIEKITYITPWSESDGIVIYQDRGHKVRLRVNKEEGESLLTSLVIHPKNTLKTVQGYLVNTQKISSVEYISSGSKSYSFILNMDDGKTIDVDYSDAHLGKCKLAELLR